jgi:hypothetical protein
MVESMNPPKNAHVVEREVYPVSEHLYRNECQKKLEEEGQLPNTGLAPPRQVVLSYRVGNGRHCSNDHGRDVIDYKASKILIKLKALFETISHVKQPDKEQLSKQVRETEQYPVGQRHS